MCVALLVAASGIRAARGRCAMVRFYNFRRVHKSLRMMPLVAAGIADHVWTVRELLRPRESAAQV